LNENRFSPGIVTAQGLTALVIVAVIALSFGSQRDARAFPAYAKKENKKCGFCHVNPAGGGKRNAAGTYYKAHGLSLVGYKPADPKPSPSAKPSPVKAKTPPAKGKPTSNK
jgi:hypothetical protein